jgi:hypothetical protein
LSLVVIVGRRDDLLGFSPAGLLRDLLLHRDQRLRNWNQFLRRVEVVLTFIPIL